MSRHDQIRRLFLSPKPAYHLREAAKVLGMKVRELRGWVAAGEIEVVEVEGGDAIAWAELVFFAMDLWPQEEIEAALGAEVAEAIPELLRLTDLEVRIPRLEVLALEQVAVRDGRSVDAVLARELLDLISSESKWLNEKIPGFLKALAWPNRANASRFNDTGI
jgi:hypothetical protein